MEQDRYKTIEAAAEAVSRDKGSRFLAYAYPVAAEEEVKEHVDALKKKHYDATHHCYAWRIGPQGEQSRANDDGEPSGTAGRPILGQILSADLTNILIVVVRYFGGTKLGVSGLISAYKESAREVIEAAEVVERTVDAYFSVTFSYLSMNGVMKVVKDLEPRVVSQQFDNVCQMELAIRDGQVKQLQERLEKCEGASVEYIGSR